MVAAPAWILEEISLKPDDTIVVLDDDNSIHSAWDFRFEPILTKMPNIKIKHFESGMDVLDFINNLGEEEKDRIVLLSDYELLRQRVNYGGMRKLDRSKRLKNIA